MDTMLFSYSAVTMTNAQRRTFDDMANRDMEMNRVRDELLTSEPELWNGNGDCVFFLNSKQHEVMVKFMDVWNRC
jgi:hypothetical protein